LHHWKLLPRKKPKLQTKATIPVTTVHILLPGRSNVFPNAGQLLFAARWFGQLSPRLPRCLPRRLQPSVANFAADKNTRNLPGDHFFGLQKDKKTTK